MPLYSPSAFNFSAKKSQVSFSNPLSSTCSSRLSAPHGGAIPKTRNVGLESEGWTTVQRKSKSGKRSMPTIKTSGKDKQNSVPSNCMFYLQGWCQFGRDGRRCPDNYPPMCQAYIANSHLGCNRDVHCNKLHPKFCVSSLMSRTCGRKNCYYYHVKGTTRSYHPSSSSKSVYTHTSSALPSSAVSSLPISSLPSSNNPKIICSNYAIGDVLLPIPVRNENSFSQFTSQKPSVNQRVAPPASQGHFLDQVEELHSMFRMIQDQLNAIQLLVSLF